MLHETIEIPALSESDIARFWSKVNKEPGQGPQGTCWEWTGVRNDHGYGMFKIDGKLYRAHRVAFIVAGEVIPRGMCILHKLDHPPCCNPAHLWSGTRGQNNSDRHMKGRGVCGDNHPARLHPENLARGEGHGSAKITANQVREVRSRYAVGGISQRRLATEYGVSYATISHIVNRKTWGHLP